MELVTHGIPSYLLLPRWTERIQFSDLWRLFEKIKSPSLRGSQEPFKGTLEKSFVSPKAPPLCWVYTESGESHLALRCQQILCTNCVQRERETFAMVMDQLPLPSPLFTLILILFLTALIFLRCSGLEKMLMVTDLVWNLKKKKKDEFLWLILEMS